MMQWLSRSPYPPATPTNMDHWLEWARAGFIAGNTEVEEFEQAVEDALSGRYVHFDGRPADHDRAAAE